MDRSAVTAKQHNSVKIGAMIALVVVAFNIAGQAIAICETRYQLVSPLVPESAITEISRPFVLQIIIFACGGSVGLVSYFFKKYVLVIILAVITLFISKCGASLF